MEHGIEDRIKELKAEGLGDHAICTKLKEDGYNLTRHRIRRIVQELEHICGDPDELLDEAERISRIEDKGESMEVTAITQARSLESLLELMDADMDKWYVRKWIGNQWGNGGMWQIKAWFEPKTHEANMIEELLDKIAEHGPIRDENELMPNDDESDTALEIAIMDPHMGLRAFKGASGHDYNPKKAEQIWWKSIDKLLWRGGVVDAPVDRIVFVAGNDFLHADNVFHTTTQGTGQPEMDAWHHTFERGEELLIRTVEALRRFARQVDVVMVPGNHARQSEYALGRLLKRYYERDRTVHVDAGPEPYKFWHYGVNLVGFEHGHSIKANRLASLMANECSQEWPTTWQREWHCGDQHRESAVFSEFGVNIKYLPSMVTWNEWHKIKSFSWAHRATLGFLFDKKYGLVGTPQVNARELFYG